jgi:hypothetical protein
MATKDDVSIVGSALKRRRAVIPGRGLRADSDRKKQRDVVPALVSEVRADVARRELPQN